MHVIPEHRHSLVVSMVFCFEDSRVTGGVVGRMWLITGIVVCWENVTKEIMKEKTSVERTL